MTTIRLIVRSAAIFAAFAFLSAPASAQGTADERSACMGDAFRFCAANIPNVAAIEACLIRNEANLTPACRAEFHPTTRRTKLQTDNFRQ